MLTSIEVEVLHNSPPTEHPGLVGGGGGRGEGGGGDGGEGGGGGLGDGGTMNTAGPEVAAALG